MSLTKNPRPFIINVNKPAGITSYDVIRKWKPILKAYGKVGHFGTLDPFADGVLMLGVSGAQKLNDYIHGFLPKTYLAKGVLGVETDTGDPDGKIIQEDSTDYLRNVIGKFDKNFIQNKLVSKFLGEYLQSPHKFSAAKFEGKPLHQWAREGIEIKKDQVKREIYQLEVVKFEFPHLWIRFQVSSGTYIRTLFRDCSIELGTIGMLRELTREKVGGSHLENAISSEAHTPFEFLEIDRVLPFGYITLNEERSKLFKNGVKLRVDQIENQIEGELTGANWVINTEKRILGLAQIIDGHIISRVNFPL